MKKESKWGGNGAYQPVPRKDKITFSWSEQFNEYTMVFTKDQSVYKYKTLDKYLFNKVRQTAEKRPGQAWNMAKSFFGRV